MNEHDKHVERGPLDDRLWDLLGEDAAPALDASVWPGVQRRTSGDPDTLWRPRLSFAGLGALCLVAGLWFGLGLGLTPGSGNVATDEADYAEGSFLGEAGWTLDGLYLLADADVEGGS